MAAGDEEIARSATPRFALESLLDSLAGLPQTLPVAELIERLERLEGKPAGASAVKERLCRRCGSERCLRRQPLRRRPRRRRSRSQRPVRARGATLLPPLARKKNFFASHLDNAKPLELPPGRLKIGVSDRQHLAFLLDGDNLATLKEQAGKFFAQDVNVQIVSQVSDAVIEARESASSANPADDRSAMVNEALRIFGGSVRTVRRDNG